MVHDNAMVPADALRDVFTSNLLAKLRASKQPSKHLRWRLDVLDACGPMPSDRCKATELRAWRAQKAAWEAYLTVAYANGLFAGNAGTDLRSRLTGVNDHNFRGAMSECLVSWFLTCRTNVGVSRYPQRPSGKSPDFLTRFSFGDAGLEVKSPACEILPAPQWVDDSTTLRRCLKTANQQFSRDHPNVLVIAPNMQPPLFHDRDTLVRAAFGGSAIVFDFNSGEGRLENARSEFRQTGAFLNRTKPSGKPLKPDGTPAYRRISAILCIEETLEDTYPLPIAKLDSLVTGDRKRFGEFWVTYERLSQAHESRDNASWIGHNAMVLHNPSAYHPVAEDVFNKWPQLVPRGDVMVWSDGYECNV